MDWGTSFVIYAIFPAIAIVVGGITLKIITHFAAKDPWKATRLFLGCFVALWGFISLVYTSVKFYKIPDDAVLRKADVYDIALHAINIQFLFFLVIFLLCFVFVNRSAKINEDK